MCNHVPCLEFKGDIISQLKYKLTCELKYSEGLAAAIAIS